MSFSTPTTSELNESILAQIEAGLGQSVPLLPKAFLRVLAKVLAGLFILLYRYAGWMFLQMFVAHASARPTLVGGKLIQPLIEWGRLRGSGDPEPATRAELDIEVTVLVQGGTLPVNSQLLFAETGVVYLTTTGVNLDAATVEVTIRASSDQDGNGGAGSIGNLDPGEIVSFANPLANIARDAVVVAQSVTGSDAESVEDYRARVLRRFQRPPQGGAYADYRLWGEEDPGIINVYPYTGLPGQVDVYAEATPESSGSADGIPTLAQLNAVLALIEADVDGLPSRRNVNAAVNVLPITRTAFDVEVLGLTGPDTATAGDALQEALDEHLRSREPFIVGLSVFPRRDRITQAGVAGVAEEVASAHGASITTVTVKLAGLPTPAYTLDDGEKSKLGTISFL